MTEIMSTADLKSLLEKRRRDRIEQDEKMEREELLREIRELENHISESNSSASSVSTSSVSASSVSASKFLMIFFSNFNRSLEVILMTDDSNSNIETYVVVNSF